MEKRLLLEIYRKMITIRLFEENVFELAAKNLIPGFIHTYIGEEAVAVGVCANLQKDDYVTSTHRGHGHCIAKGADVKRMMAELFGKETGYCRGHGGSMHIADHSTGILGATGIVGAGIPMAVGAGLSIKYRGSKQVAVSFFGDGAANHGTFHEALNLASLWKLPVIFVCENNLYAAAVPLSKSTLIKNIADRASAYCMPGVVVDGNDVLAVYEAACEAVRRAREGEGPTLIECKTYRWRGHFEGDSQPYRTKQEVEEWMKKCPIESFKAKLIEMGVLTREEAEKIDAEVSKEVAKAVKFAEESSYPSPENNVCYVFG
jgi:pyruvate dehydrogenase E1 component alpha subunit